MDHLVAVYRLTGCPLRLGKINALEQALYARRPVNQGGLIHHSVRGVQYVPIRYTERLFEAGVEPSVGSVGDAYDNALAETINGLYKAEMIHRRSWQSREAVELATLEWVDWFNHRRLLEPIGNMPPAEAEAFTIDNLPSRPKRHDSHQRASRDPGAVQSCVSKGSFIVADGEQAALAGWLNVNASHK
ncbi:hypothetical protein GCM10027398_32980 [Azotobacter salinestris]